MYCYADIFCLLLYLCCCGNYAVHINCIVLYASIHVNAKMTYLLIIYFSQCMYNWIWISPLIIRLSMQEGPEMQWQSDNALIRSIG